MDLQAWTPGRVDNISYSFVPTDQLNRCVSRVYGFLWFQEDDLYLHHPLSNVHMPRHMLRHWQYILFLSFIPTEQMRFTRVRSLEPEHGFQDDLYLHHPLSNVHMLRHMLRHPFDPYDPNLCCIYISMFVCPLY